MFMNSFCRFKVSGCLISFCPNDVGDNLYKHMSEMNEGQICSEGLSCCIDCTHANVYLDRLQLKHLPPPVSR